MLATVEQAELFCVVVIIIKYINGVLKIEGRASAGTWRRAAIVPEESSQYLHKLNEYCFHVVTHVVRAVTCTYFACVRDMSQEDIEKRASKLYRNSSSGVVPLDFSPNDHEDDTTLKFVKHGRRSHQDTTHFSVSL